MQDKRCSWCELHPIYRDYHDYEWGTPLFSDQKLFEFLLLEGAQAGLSWITILKKREDYRLAFDDFNAEKIANYNTDKIVDLLNNPGIVRNKRKIHAFIHNAQAYRSIIDKHHSFSEYLWQFTQHNPRQNRWETLSDVPTQTAESMRMSKQLKQDGFSFVGPTICYAFMQATGMVNDHLVDCFRHQQLATKTNSA